jgi:hypothetical protein
MAGIDQLKNEIRDRVKGVVAPVLARTGASSSADGFGFAPTMLLAALGQRDAGGLAGSTGSTISIDDALAEVAQARGAPITPAEAARIRQLLQSGEVVRDLGAGMAVALELARSVPASIYDDAIGLPELPGDLVSAVQAELSAFDAGSAIATLKSLRQGSISQPPRIFPHTLRLVLRHATLRSAIEAARSAIAPENETLRLALIVYARSQGFDLDEGDLNALRDALATTDPDLGSLAARGLERVRDRFGGGHEALNVIQRLAGQ